MNPHKIIQLIIGITLACAGIYCIISPGVTIAALAWIIGLFMIIHALSRLSVWQKRRALGFGENYELISAVLSLLFGIALIISNFLQTAISTFIIYILSSWIAMLGIFRLLTASALRRLDADISVHINNYHSQMISGVLLILIAVVIFLRPSIITAMLGIVIGACLVGFGVSQILAVLRQPHR